MTRPDVSIASVGTLLTRPDVSIASTGTLLTRPDVSIALPYCDRLSEQWTICHFRLATVATQGAKHPAVFHLRALSEVFIAELILSSSCTMQLLPT